MVPARGPQADESAEREPRRGEYRLRHEGECRQGTAIGAADTRIRFTIPAIPCPGAVRSPGSVACPFFTGLFAVGGGDAVLETDGVPYGGKPNRFALGLEVHNQPPQMRARGVVN